VERLLVRLPNWIGDTIMATPALKALRDGFPGAEISWLHMPYLAELIAGCPWYDRLLPFEGSRPQNAWRLRQGRFDTAVVFPNSPGALVPAWLAGIPRRIGYNRYCRGWMLTDALAPPRNGRGLVMPVAMPAYYSRLLHPLGLRVRDLRPCLPYDGSLDTELDRRLGEEDGFDPDRPTVCFHPGASYGSAKCWPPEHFARLGDLVLDTFRVNLVITLGPRETALEPLISGAMQNQGTFLKLPLRLLPPLFRRIRLLVSNDTGPRHIGVAMERPSVVLFGPSDIRYTKMNLERTRVVMRDDLPCLPCTRRVCPLGHHDCMIGISAEQVFSQVEELLLDSAHGPVEKRG